MHSKNGICDNCEKEVNQSNNNRKIKVTYKTREDKNKEKYVDCVSVFYNIDKARKAVYRYKFNDCKYYDTMFALELFRKVSKLYSGYNFDVITYVPISKRRFKERGYDQSCLLAKKLSKYMKLPEKQLLVKIKDNQVQHRLSLDERRKNVIGVYEAANVDFIKDKNLIICDDIVTTGSTLAECCKILLESEAKSILCVTINTTGKEDVYE